MNRSNLLYPIIIILIGFYFVLKNIFGIQLFDTLNFDQTWPILLLIYGIYLFFREKKQ